MSLNRHLKPLFIVKAVEQLKLFLVLASFVFIIGALNNSLINC